MGNIWIIGDSFSDENSPGVNRNVLDKSAWSTIIKENFIGDDIFLLGRGGMDANTILDTLLINLSQIKPDDLVIIYLPTIWRHRFPLQKIHWGKYEDMIDKVVRNKKTHKLLNSFMHSNLLEQFKEYLEPPFCMDSVKIRDNENAEGKNQSLDNQLDFYRMATCSDSQVHRIEQILNSIKNTLYKTKFEFFTWSDEWNTDLIQNTNKIRQLIGVYETLHQQWTLSNGAEGIEGDSHFSNRMHRMFAKHIMDKYPKYFKTKI